MRVAVYENVAAATPISSLCVVGVETLVRFAEVLVVLKTLSRTQRATKVEKFCLKRLRLRVIPRNMSEKADMLIIPTNLHSAFSA